MFQKYLFCVIQDLLVFGIVFGVGDFFGYDGFVVFNGMCDGIY